MKQQELLPQNPDDRMSSAYLEEVKRSYDESFSKQYRHWDDVAVASRAHYCNLLGDLSRSFGRKIDVLDAGCGTGRFFHCLKNVRRLVGVDISAHMLSHARNPVGMEHLEIEQLDLICGDFATVDLPNEGFDFICSIGVLSDHVPIDVELLNRFAKLLKPDGVLFFTAVDSHSRLHIPYDQSPSLKMRLLRRAFRHMPKVVRRRSTGAFHLIS